MIISSLMAERRGRTGSTFSGKTRRDRVERDMSKSSLGYHVTFTFPEFTAQQDLSAGLKAGEPIAPRYPVNFA